MTQEQLIAKLGLALHPTEGGYFRRTYESKRHITQQSSSRRLLTTIYYLLTSNSPHGYLHKNKSDIIHFHHFGSALKYWVISADGCLQEYLLGPDIANGHTPQLLVKAGDWKISQLCSGDFGLISEAVAPGFEYDDYEIATFAQIEQLFPDLVSKLQPFIKTK